ncbi:MAG TPA: hypothetical protein PLZ89_01445 [Bacteroidales bacterium]|nr:hypothetical protein [Bacteroidales bacterium]
MKTPYYLLSFALLLVFSACQPKVQLLTTGSDSPRGNYAKERLSNSLLSNGYTIVDENPAGKATKIYLGCQNDLNFQQTLQEQGLAIEPVEGKEAFRIVADGDKIAVCGADESGLLYGCMELIDRLKTNGRLPKKIDYSDAPDMVLRGTCIGMQKMYLLPGRKVYEYPYTQELFPWFYDKELWIKYLDMLVENRMNSVYLWNGHPFASLVKLPDYPYAVEVSEEDFERNEEMFGFLAQEANKRGIWVIQMFYNIIVSQPFADYHKIPTQDRKVEITPLLSDYTRKSVAAFIEKYPNVGLLVCLGEAMNTHEDDVEWFTETIIPGVKDGLKALGLEQEPPIVLRAHDTNAEMVMDAALPIYKNLYTMNKYNGESLCTYQPRGPWTATHQALSALGSVHISNVHILANLEPFRYGSPDFIQKSIQAMHNIHGANGLHLYPQASYWDWPYAADKIEDGSRLLEMDRDWIWYQSWARYAWSADRDRKEEIDYWSGLLSELYNCGKQGKYILEAYEQSGEISPKLLRKFGITEGNRQTFLLGMFMSQLVNPNRWTVYPDFANSCGPEGEKLEVWAYREWHGEAHVGETPPQLIAETREHARKAVEAIDKVTRVRKNKEEFARLKNDIYAYKAFTDCFTDKLEASMLVLRYSYSNEISDLEQAYSLMESSLDHYRKLEELTRDSYLYANSMQTGMRRIPVTGNNGANKTWTELLPQFEQELARFDANIQKLKSGNQTPENLKVLSPAEVKLISPARAEFYQLQEGASVYSDRPFKIKALAPELSQLKALRMSNRQQLNENIRLRFNSREAVDLWVAYFKPFRQGDYMPAPRLETDASANQYGQADIKIANAMEIENLPAVNVHQYRFEAGEHNLNLGKGLCLVLGFSKPEAAFSTRDAGFMEKTAIDWLFY